MKIKNGFILREVGGTALVVAVGELAKKFNGMITLNEVGAFLWRGIEAGKDEDALVSALLSEYDVDEATARRDVEAYINKMKAAGVLDE